LHKSRSEDFINTMNFVEKIPALTDHETFRRAYYGVDEKHAHKHDKPKTVPLHHPKDLQEIERLKKDLDEAYVILVSEVNNLLG
jgi:hypothetical protein